MSNEKKKFLKLLHMKIFVPILPKSSLENINEKYNLPKGTTKTFANGNARNRYLTQNDARALKFEALKLDYDSL